MSFLTPAKVTVAMLGVVGLLTGGYFVKSMLARDERPLPKREKVPMVTSDIPAGTLITREHLALGPISPDQLATAPDIAMSQDVIVNRIAKEPIKAVTPIRTSQLYRAGDFPSLEINPGMRAVSLSVGDSTNLVSGLIKSGQYVDVHLTPGSVPDDERTGGGLTMTLFKGVKVLAVNRTQSGAGIDRGGNQVTLELTPRQSNVIIQAKEKGALTLTYNPEATEEVPPAPKASDDRATYNEILGLPPVPPPQPPQMLEIYRGSGRAVLAFRDGKYPDIYAATTARPLYGAGAPYGNDAGWGGFNGNFNGRNPPAPVWFQSHPGNGSTGAPSDTQGNGPAPSGLPRVYPSAQMPPAPRT